MPDAAQTLNKFPGLLAAARGRRFRTILADPPWRFQNATGKVAPGHKRLNRYGTMSLADIEALPVAEIATKPATSIFGRRTRCCPKGSP